MLPSNVDDPSFSAEPPPDPRRGSEWSPSELTLGIVEAVLQALGEFGESVLHALGARH